MDKNFFRNLRAMHWILLACGAFLVLLVASWIGWWVADWMMLNYHRKVEWEAWATFATGVLAVSAALIVGLEQANIQRAQVKMTGQTLRHELLDRRLSLLQDLEKFDSLCCDEIWMKSGKYFIQGPEFFKIRSRIRLIFSENMVFYLKFIFEA